MMLTIIKEDDDESSIAFILQCVVTCETKTLLRAKQNCLLKVFCSVERLGAKREIEKTERSFLVFISDTKKR